MKQTVLRAIFCLLTVNFACAELLIGGATEARQIVVESNEVIFITGIMVRSGPEIESWGFVVGGRTNKPSQRLLNVEISRPIALAGPLQFFVQGPVAISYQRIFNAEIKSLFIDPSGTYTIDVPAGKRLKFLFHGAAAGVAGANGPVQFLFLVKDGVETGPYFPTGEPELDGPLQIHFSGADNTSGVADARHPFPLSYYMTENAAILPGSLALKAPTGTSIIAIEKSQDLTNWISSALVPTSNDTSAYYRIRTIR